MVVGNKGKKKIGFVRVIWAPMTALIVHKFALMGTKRFVQIGYCGGLILELKYGEVLVVAEALSEDGVTSQYFPKQNRFQSSESLVEKSVDFLKQRSVPFQVGKVVSTSAMFLETNDLVKFWAEGDLVGVDGETSTTLAIASKFGAESISLLTCSDNLSLGHNLYEQACITEKSQDAALGQIQNLAFELAIAD